MRGVLLDVYNAVLFINFRYGRGNENQQIFVKRISKKKRKTTRWHGCD